MYLCKLGEIISTGSEDKAPNYISNSSKCILVQKIKHRTEADADWWSHLMHIFSSIIYWFKYYTKHCRPWSAWQGFNSIWFSKLLFLYFLSFSRPFLMTDNIHSHLRAVQKFVPNNYFRWVNIRYLHRYSFSFFIDVCWFFQSIKRIYLRVKWFGSRSGPTLVPIWSQTVYKGYQQMTKVALSMINL